MNNSHFLSDLVVELAEPWANDGAGMWRLLEPLNFYSHRVQKVLSVDTDFTTDFASVPRLPLAYAAFGNRFHRSAVVHDWLCRTRAVDRDVADKVFLDAMRVEIEEAATYQRSTGADDEEINEYKAKAEGAARTMYAAVALYTKTGLWKKDHAEFAKTMHTGVPGDCELCGMWDSWLVDGVCSSCRKKHNLP